MARTYKPLTHYLNLPWTYTIETTHEGTTPLYLIRVNELPGVCTDATSLNTAMECAQEAMIATFKAYMHNNEDIPEPPKKTEELSSGSIAYHTTQHRHARIVQEALKRNTSLSQLLDTLIDENLSNNND